MLLWVYFCVIFLFALCVYVVRFHRQIRLALKLPGAKAYPLIGNYNIIRGHSGEHSVQYSFQSLLVTRTLLNPRILFLPPAIQEMTGCYERYGPIARLWVSIIPCFVVMGPDEIQKILSSKAHIDKSPFYNIMRSYIGDSIALANGESWHAKRKLLNPVFHLNVIEKLFGYMTHGGSKLCDNLEQQKEGINITSYLNNCIDQILNCKSREAGGLERSYLFQSSFLNLPSGAILGVPLNQDSSSEVNVFRK